MFIIYFIFIFNFIFKPLKITSFKLNACLFIQIIRRNVLEIEETVILDDILVDKINGVGVSTVVKTEPQ